MLLRSARLRLAPYFLLLALWALVLGLNCALLYLVFAGRATWPAYLGALVATSAVTFATQSAQKALPPRSHRLRAKRVRALSGFALTLGEAVALEDAVPENRGHRVYPIQLKEALAGHLADGEVDDEARQAFAALVAAGVLIDRRRPHERWLAFSADPRAASALASERARRQARPLGPRSRLGPLAG